MEIEITQSATVFIYLSFALKLISILRLFDRETNDVGHELDFHREQRSDWIPCMIESLDRDEIGMRATNLYITS